ncbi:MAG: hypothetical protein WBF04_25030 [Candidatus Sulfotelmatobacter sp.]
MTVRVSINKMNSGRMQICCARPGSSGYVMTYAAASAKAEVTKTLLALGFSAETINGSLDMLSDFGPDEMLQVEELDISDDVLHANGFIAV